MGNRQAGETPALRYLAFGRVRFNSLVPARASGDCSDTSDLLFDVNKLRVVIMAGWIVGQVWSGGASAQPIPVPNGSFESPATQYVSTRIGSWQEMPKPTDFNEGGGFLWDQLTGVFRNTLPGAADHIDNCDGLQAIYFFAVPAVGLFQDHDSADWDDAAPTHDFDARFEAGKAYALSFGVIAGGGNMLEGVGFEAALYFRDDATRQVTVVANNVVFTRAVFPNRTHLTDFTLRTPVVQAGDAWAGKHIGIRFLSTVSDEIKGGYWDLDNVRLTAIGEPVFRLEASPVGSDLRVSWPSVTGYRYQLQSSADLRTWADLGEPLAGTGEALAQLVPLSGPQPAFFNVRATPTP